MKGGFKNISTQLIAIILVVTVLTIIPTLLVCGWIQYRALKQDLAQNIDITGHLIGEYCISPLIFEDRAGADEVLKRLGHIPNIQAAVLRDKSGAVFAVYSRNDAHLHQCQGGSVQNGVFANGFYCISLPVIYEGETYGTIVIHADTSEIYPKIRGFGITLLPWALGIFALALFLAVLLQRKISGPITHLADITQRIAVSEDFSIRAPAGRNDEIGHLYDGFNNMLAHLADREIQRDLARKEKERLESQLFQAQKMESVGRLAGGVAHDFNNILSVITGYSELSLIELDEDHPIYENIKTIMESGQRAARLTQQLLAFSRKQVVHKEKLNVKHEIELILKMIKRLLGEDIEIDVVHESEDLCIIADRSQLEQIILNLSVNARDAMPKGGSLTIETRMVNLSPETMIRHFDIEAGPHACIIVTDTGEGMPPDVINQIFEPFFTTKEGGKGTGLGLSTVYGIIKQNKGYIDVYSEPGSGTAFKIYLPIIDEHHTETPTDSPLNEGRDGHCHETILLVEDDANLRRMLSSSLSRQGYTIIEAENGEQGTAVFEDNKDRIDLLITDMVMPGKNGLDMAMEFQATCAELRVILMSGYTENTLIRDGNIPADITFINKPVTPSSLARVIGEALGPTVPLPK
nr:ATP-binding protein [uncultured Desulfobacter sp.]